jgi:integrase
MEIKQRLRGRHVNLQTRQSLLVQVHVERGHGSRIHPSTQPKHSPTNGGRSSGVPCKRRSWNPRTEDRTDAGDFISQRFEPWAEASTSPKTWLDYYRPGIRTIQRYKPLANLRLNEITSEKASDFAAWRQSAGLQVSSVNSSLQVLRRVMRLAAQWRVIEAAPSVKMLPGERHREHVVKPDEEARYLAAAPEPLGSVAAILTDTGMRPDECYRLRWESVTWTNGRNGTILVTHGKTTAARRVLPLTVRTKNILLARWQVGPQRLPGSPLKVSDSRMS